VQSLDLADPIELTLDDPEDFYPCRASFHPLHERCRAKASYVILADCPLCETRPSYFCASHCPGYFEAYFTNSGWCPCSTQPDPHDYVNVRVRGL
jgi:hypothetical protein